MTDHPDDAVAKGNECPCCGENEIDQLVWLDDETVQCQNCGTTYNPNDPGAERNDQ
jgi:uncharacterized Zn finger protein